MSSTASRLTPSAAAPSSETAAGTADLPSGLEIETGHGDGAERSMVIRSTVRAKLPRVVSVSIGAIVAIALVATAGHVAAAVAAGIVLAAVATIFVLSPTSGSYCFEVTDHDLRLSGLDNREAAQRHATIPFDEIERISVEPSGADIHPAIVIQTASEALRTGAALPEPTLQWIKSRLTSEIARRNWRSGEDTARDSQKARIPIITNPVMLKPDLAVKLIKIFLTETPGRIDELRKAVTADDFGAAQRHAHWLKTASANVGAKHMSELCLLTEQFARDRELSHGRILCDEISRKFDKMKCWLEDLRITAVERMMQIRSDAFMQTAVSSALDEVQDGARALPDAVTTLPPAFNARILVVDDSSVSREIACEFLGCLVSDVSIAKNGEEAITSWREGAT